MKKIFLIFAAAVALSPLAWAQTSARSMFIDGFDESKYKETTVSEDKKNCEEVFIGKIKQLDGQRLKTKCHICMIDNLEFTLVFYGDGERFPITWFDVDYFPDEMPLFTPLEIYYHHEAYYHEYYKEWYYRNVLDGWCVLDDIRFVGQKYIATDALRIRKSPSLSAEQVGRLSKDERATVIEVGEKVTIDGIESAWVKVRTKDGAEGWCFAGYLTDGTEYREKPWTSGETAISLEKAHFEKILCAYDWYRTDEYRSSILRFYKEDGKLYLNVYLRDCYRDDLCIELQERGLAVEIEETGDGKLFCACDKIFYYLGKDVFYDGKTRHALYFFDDRPSVYAYDKYESGIGKE